MNLKPPALWVAGLLVALLVAGAGYLSLRATGRPAAVAQHSLRPDDPQVLRVGASIYTQQCATCHGAKGEGQADWRERGADGLLPAPPHDPSGHTWHHPDEQLFAITQQGLAQLINQPDYRTAMPIYGGMLSDEEIVAVLSWIKAQWPPEIRQRHDEINAQYRKSLSR
ncbi:cytochrome c [Acidovorax sp. JHL-9]|uniref:c-type cytochrome n=1 Tax=Acidovorax sp. JHL-9 TaxID=1276756 RepID=UPI000427DBA3|nr:cytochrome c [Acidovorax sp. JHL-9]